jgi:hypothetical protein
MKKYRSLWCMSTTNHNILYLACIPRTCLLNTAICLWKAQDSRSQCGLCGLVLLQTGCTRGAGRPCSGPMQKPSPRHTGKQGSKTVQSGRIPVRTVDNRACSLDDSEDSEIPRPAARRERLLSTQSTTDRLILCTRPTHLRSTGSPSPRPAPLPSAAAP